MSTQDRQSASDTLAAAQTCIDAISGRTLPSDRVQAQLTHARTLVHAAAVHALLDLADAIREGQQQA